MDLEPRIVRLEDAMSGIQVALGRIVEQLAGFEARFDRLDARLDRLEARLDTVAGHVAEVRGTLRTLPSTWQMITIIVGGQISLVDLTAAIAFGTLRMIGH